MTYIKTFILIALLSVSLEARQKVNLNFSDLQINDFIKLVAKITHKNILINYKVNGKVDLVTTTTVYDDEVLGILVSVLESKGFTIVNKGSIYEVVRSADAAKHSSRIIKPGKYAYGNTMATQTIKVEGQNVDIVAAKIRYLISKTAKLMTLKETNTLLVTDYPRNIRMIKKIIKNLTVSSEPEIKILTIEKADLKKITAQATEIAKNLFNAKVNGQSVKVLQNTDINGLILIGDTDNIKQLETIIKTLDKEQNLDEEVQIFNLKNSDAKATLATLNEIVSKQTFSDPTLKPNISASEEINAIILVGNPTVIKGLRRILDELDREKYQVYVQARIVEINKNDSQKIGIKYGIDGGIATSSGLYTFSGNFGGSAIASQAIQSIIGSGAGGALGNISQGLLLGASLDFLKKNGASKTVSNPSVLCVNNKESSIYVGKTISIATGSINATTGSTTNSFKREDIGLTLKIKPRVSSSEKVTLDVETILENVVGVDDNNQPITTKQTITTESILRHGESIIIGGLVKTYKKEDITKVPILGDIPLIGTLFTHKDLSDQQDNLLVILTPYVIDQSAQLSTLQKQLGELGKLQKEFNKKVFPIVEKNVDESKLSSTKEKKK